MFLAWYFDLEFFFFLPLNCMILLILWVCIRELSKKITDDMSHILSSIISDISLRLTGLPVGLMLANTFLVNTKSSIK